MDADVCLSIRRGFLRGYERVSRPPGIDGILYLDIGKLGKGRFYHAPPTDGMIH